MLRWAVRRGARRRADHSRVQERLHGPVRLVVPPLANADDGIFDDNLCEILAASSRVATSLDLDLAFGAVDFLKQQSKMSPQVG